MAETLRAVVTGASSGIGEATVRQLTAQGWDVFAAARREDRLGALAEETGAHPVVTDVTSDADVAALAETVLAAGPVHAVVNIAGGAVGADTVATGKIADWQKMYDINVLGVLRVTQAFLPALRASGRGDVLVLTSTASQVAYEGGGGYNAAKFGAHALAGALRLEEAENGIRVIEIAPGMVKTEEFSLNRLHGDQAAADKVYAGVDKPLTADDVATTVTWALNLPHHIDIDLLTVRPVEQASQFKVIRKH